MELVRSTSMRQAQLFVDARSCGKCMTLSIVSRMEAIAVRDEALKLPVRDRLRILLQSVNPECRQRCVARQVGNVGGACDKHPLL